ncbi:GNAT family N-acetyltransferase [Acidomonas methanolica]|nr:GNAT family N-acetyltransferase [Acidomonas methanolica]
MSAFRFLWRTASDGLSRWLSLGRPASDRKATVVIRPFRCGDVGLVIARQATIYEQEQGWGRPLEALMLETGARFLAEFRPGRDQCWIAEIDGMSAGSVFLTDEGDGLARLRLLYVEPRARGQGVADLLVAACIGFAREAGYARVTLWTHTVLAAARRLYARHGFRLVAQAEHEAFGVPVQGETWELALER